MRKTIVGMLVLLSFIIKAEVSELDQLIDEHALPHKKVSTPCFTKLSAQALEVCSLLVNGDATIAGETTLCGPTTIKNNTTIDGDLIVTGEIFCNSQPICPGGGGTSGTEGTEGTEGPGGSEGSEPGGSGTGGGGGFTSTDYLFATYNTPAVTLLPGQDFFPNLIPEYQDGWQQDGTEIGAFIVPKTALYHVMYETTFDIAIEFINQQKGCYLVQVLFEIDGAILFNGRRVSFESHNLFELDFLSFVDIFRTISNNFFIELTAGSQVRLRIVNASSCDFGDAATLNFHPSPFMPNFSPGPYVTLTIVKIADM